MMVLPDEEGPNSFDRSTVIVRMLPAMVISTFFMDRPPRPYDMPRRDTT
jgi:hypothetical protein